MYRYWYILFFFITYLLQNLISKYIVVVYYGTKVLTPPLAHLQVKRNWKAKIKINCKSAEAMQILDRKGVNTIKIKFISNAV